MTKDQAVHTNTHLLPPGQLVSILQLDTANAQLAPFEMYALQEFHEFETSFS